jgi:hypothetical protein
MQERRNYGESEKVYEGVHSRDKRPESYSPVPDKPIMPGKSIDTKHGWAERRNYVLAKGTHTMCHLNSLEITEKSLGIVKPREVTELAIEPAERDWKPEYTALFKQKMLFGPDPKPLEKIPYSFSYCFRCEDPTCKGHMMKIEDWEIGQLYRNMRDKYKDENVAVEKVKERFFDTMCSQKKDTHFFVGRVFAYPTWIILGVFWPPRLAN